MGCTDIASELQGLKDHIISREEFLKLKLKSERADALDIYWYVTSTARKDDNPKEIEFKILQKHMEIYEEVARWNKLDH
jgi:hypothetical protein